MINWPPVFFSQGKALFRKSVMIGSGVLIQMRFTLSMVNRFLWCVVKRNIFRMRKIDSDVSGFLFLGWGYL